MSVVGRKVFLLFQFIISENFSLYSCDSKIKVNKFVIPGKAMRNSDFPAIRNSAGEED